MVRSDRASSAGYGFGGGPGRGKSKGGPSVSSKDRGSPRTKNIPDKATYRMGGLAEPFSNAIAGHFQKQDIQKAYKDYKASPPSLGMTSGAKRASLKAAQRPWGAPTGPTKAAPAKAAPTRARLAPTSVSSPELTKQKQAMQSAQMGQSQRFRGMPEQHKGLKNSEVSKGISKSSGYRGGKGHG